MPKYVGGKIHKQSSMYEPRHKMEVEGHTQCLLTHG